MKSTKIFKKNNNYTDCLNASVEVIKRAMKSASNWKWTWLSGDEIQFIGEKALGMITACEINILVTNDIYS